MIRDAVAVRLSPEERAVLEAKLRAPTTEQRQVFHPGKRYPQPPPENDFCPGSEDEVRLMPPSDILRGYRLVCRRLSLAFL